MTQASLSAAPPQPLPDVSAPVVGVLLLAALAAVGQFASNVYTPSLPFVADDLGVSTAATQATLGIFLAAFAVAQLFHGPLADRFGRRPVLFVSLAIFLLGTVGCALAPSLPALLAARAVQAAGAAGALIVSRAVTRDVFEGIALQKAMAAITIAFALVPGLTPLIGGIVQETLGWRATFWLTTGVASVLLVYAAINLPETIRQRSTAINPRAVATSYLSVLADREAMTFALASGCVFGAITSFYAASPALFIERLGVGPAEYGLYPPFAATGFVLGGIVTRRLAGKVTPQRMMKVGLTVMITGLTAMLLFPLLGVLHKHAFSAMMVVNVTGLGIFLPTTISQVLARFPANAGTASAVQGFVQMSGGASGVLIVGLVQTKAPILAMPAVMLTLVLLAMTVLLIGLRRSAPVA